ncbi:hypothetical protein A2382_00115 [Candidatus Woesebacteria bacterium RIFOXYB1_FULL_38_16]|uniref:Uncharacterized protein n=1 Tax=Candidatus Woesebacteria bacterium RIFOXYB1_FULL_38_16 TaxID=1802538 RepID=A0A1F8CWJ6_9BACT|nr:MAG: hypothetical protein A2191_00785 [Candidatus Woesebacteria bacterium RIFOXYA1_FULL_38_9]OGM80179.1 MAG: hypothetical protein A2382_00115 [Candidatus Woesebacteria bacterium RIFOXYB1_FULL_38_16]
MAYDVKITLKIFDNPEKVIEKLTQAGFEDDGFTIKPSDDHAIRTLKRANMHLTVSYDHHGFGLKIIEIQAKHEGELQAQTMLEKLTAYTLELLRIL